ncbi:GntR family transcriptional regulator [Lactobacillus curvatus]|uniref:GntR family transcriptional regulator n=1 Tax=Latilactobacillus fragifolii TaxID=2814244 RepID=UPI0012AFAD40|nr:GntR family transcriptional regulator [Latilactobacillus fragifolii]MSD83112.1 GntR family transcriptional regulator [Latilactobacillus curvatus]MSE23210.1 GntR family transcriptional regulator [Latilactobacillus curvatus]
MFFEFNNDIPIYRQIADQIEEGIFTGVFPPESQVPSTTEISRQFNINPATVLKGMNQLVEKGLIEKKRGRGMFVTTTAPQQINQQRQAEFFDHYVAAFITKAQQLHLSKDDLIALIERGYQND